MNALSNATEKVNKDRTQRKNCYVCGVLLKEGEEYKKGNENTDIRWFCEIDYNTKPKKPRKQVVLIKR